LGGAWRNGIYAHHHYDNTTHKMLGVASGSVPAPGIGWCFHWRQCPV
jgi:uncharacterized protein YjlB